MQVRLDTNDVIYKNYIKKYTSLLTNLKDKPSEHKRIHKEISQIRPNALSREQVRDRLVENNETLKRNFSTRNADIIFDQKENNVEETGTFVNLLNYNLQKINDVDTEVEFNFHKSTDLDAIKNRQKELWLSFLTSNGAEINRGEISEYIQNIKHLQETYNARSKEINDNYDFQVSEEGETRFHTYSLYHQWVPMTFFTESDELKKIAQAVVHSETEEVQKTEKESEKEKVVKVRAAKKVAQPAAVIPPPQPLPVVLPKGPLPVIAEEVESSKPEIKVIEIKEVEKKTKPRTKCTASNPAPPCQDGMEVKTLENGLECCYKTPTKVKTKKNTNATGAAAALEKVGGGEDTLSEKEKLKAFVGNLYLKKTKRNSNGHIKWDEIDSLGNDINSTFEREASEYEGEEDEYQSPPLIIHDGLIDVDISDIEVVDV